MLEVVKVRKAGRATAGAAMRMAAGRATARRAAKEAIVIEEKEIVVGKN